MAEKQIVQHKNYFTLIFLTYISLLLFLGDILIISISNHEEIWEIISLMNLGVILIISVIGLVFCVKEIIRPTGSFHPLFFALSRIEIILVILYLVIMYFYLPSTFEQAWSSIFMIYPLIYEMSGKKRFFSPKSTRSIKKRSFFNQISILSNISVIIVGVLLWNKYSFSTIQHIYGYVLIIALSMVLIETLFEFFFHRANFSIASYTALQILFFALIIIISVLFTAEILFIHRIVYFYLILTTGFALRFKMSEPIYSPNNMSYSI